MNALDDLVIDENSFAYRDIIGRDKWEAFTPAFTSLAVVGATAYMARFRRIGRSVEFQVQLSAATSIASTAGTTYLSLPINARGLAGIAVMTNDNTNIAVGVCHLSVSTSRCYLPAQVASGNVFNVCGSYEI